jgi:protein-disulfide isomerase
MMYLQTPLRSFTLALLALALSFAAPAIANAAPRQPAACKALSGSKQTLANKLLSSQHPYACCDETIASCLKQKKVCRLAWRLAASVCRRVAQGENEKVIVRALSRRARSMLAGLGAKAKIDLAGWPAVGPKDAKVTVVEYACARCPFCSKITPGLHSAVTKGKLKGKVRLVFKPFPIRNHKWSKEAGLGFTAAIRLGGFWKYALHLYKHFDAFSPDKQKPWARAVGLDCGRFAQLVKDKKTRKLLIAAKKEGLRNKVKATPTFFINGRRYVGDPSLKSLVDVLAEEVERSSGKTYR